MMFLCFCFKGRLAGQPPDLVRCEYRSAHKVRHTLLLFSMKQCLLTFRSAVSLATMILVSSAHYNKLATGDDRMRSTT